MSREDLQVPKPLSITAQYVEDSSEKVTTLALADRRNRGIASWIARFMLCTMLCFNAVALAAGPAYQAGSISFKAGKKGIAVPFESPMPDSDYVVVVQETNTGGYSPTKECTYFNVLKKEPTRFLVQHKTCKDGRPKALVKNVSLNWIAISDGTFRIAREVCYDGSILRFNDEPIGCIYTAAVAKGREKDLCGGDNTRSFKSVGFGLVVPPGLPGGPQVIGCLACIHGERKDVFDALKVGPYPIGFTPGVSCLGYHRFDPVPFPRSIVENPDSQLPEK